MGADEDFIQRAEVFTGAVVSALLYGAFDAVIGVTIHNEPLLSFSVLPESEKENGELSSKC